MGSYKYLIIITVLRLTATQEIYETDMNFRVDAGTRTCFFEHGKAGQVMELIYQVLDGQHGDLDISVDVIDPSGTKILSDYKKPENSHILDLNQDGDYVICLDNTFSVLNSKLVFVYVVIDDRNHDNDIEVSTINEDGEEESEIVEWLGTDAEGNNYTVEVNHIVKSLTRTLHSVARARHMLDLYSATKSRDSYIASKDTFIVDIWSLFQIIFMVSVGLLQVFVIKKLFDRPCFKVSSF